MQDSVTVTVMMITMNLVAICKEFVRIIVRISSSIISLAVLVEARFVWLSIEYRYEPVSPVSKDSGPLGLCVACAVRITKKWLLYKCFQN